MRLLIDDVLHVGDPALAVPQTVAAKVAAGLQLLELGGDGVHPILADGGQAPGGIVPGIRQGEHLGQKTTGLVG